MKKIEQLTQDEKFMGYYGLEEKHKWHASKTNRLAKSTLEKKMDIENIIYVTGLAKEEITSLMWFCLWSKIIQKKKTTLIRLPKHQ